MAFYREVDGDIIRDYSLQDVVEQFHTEKALLEIVPSKAFGEMIFLDGELQFARKDEYIYHEMLVHPAMSSQGEPKDVCILGGGDGCAAREVLKWLSVDQIDIYDYDATLVELFREDFSYMNNSSLKSIKVRTYPENVKDLVVNKNYDVVIVDLIDPHYDDIECQTTWYTLLTKLPELLKPTGSLVVNAGSLLPWKSRDLDWVHFRLAEQFQQNTTHTLEAYKVFVPSFANEYCFFLIRPLESSLRLSMFDDSSKTRYFSNRTWLTALEWSKDMSSNVPSERVKLNGYLPAL